jgi:hypothetical protein
MIRVWFKACSSPVYNQVVLPPEHKVAPEWVEFIEAMQSGPQTTEPKAAKEWHRMGRRRVALEAAEESSLVDDSNGDKIRLSGLRDKHYIRGRSSWRFKAPRVGTGFDNGSGSHEHQKILIEVHFAPLSSSDLSRFGLVPSPHSWAHPVCDEVRPPQNIQEAEAHEMMAKAEALRRGESHRIR